jgi:FkbM family methyltransferase
MSEPLVIYGLGSTGQRIVDELLHGGVAIDLILDRGKAGQSYRDIPVHSLDDGNVAGRTVLIALHNHYVDLHALDANLRSAGAADILTPIHLPRLVRRSTISGYWLDPAYDYDANAAAFARARALLADDTSRDLFDGILRYRRTGLIADCPPASLDDEYTPRDLPRYPEPLRLIDCGAFTGVAIHKFLSAGYAIDSAIAFEPDPASFATLAARNFPIARRLNLPLGTWSSTTQLRFASDSSMASHLNAQGDTVIQCVAIDDVIGGEPVNVVKLDVEGAEVETLKGMARLIREQRPNLLVSAYHTPAHLHEIATLIDDWALGYRFHLRVHEQNSFGVVLYALPA